MVNVPQLDFKGPGFASFWRDGIGSYYYGTPQAEVSQLVTSIAATGQIPVLQSPGLNTSWSIDFHGPSLRCGETSDDFNKLLRESCTQAHDWATHTFGTEWFENELQTWRYLSWPASVPKRSDRSQKLNMPWNLLYLSTGEIGGNDHTTLKSSYTFRTKFFSQAGYINGYSVGGDPYRYLSGSSFWVAINPFSSEKPPSIIECGLRNSSYHVGFKYANGVQDVSIALAETSVEVDPIRFFGSPSRANLNQTKSETEWLVDGHKVLNLTILETTAYQAIFEAFGNLLTGSIVRTESDLSGGNWGTQVFSTALKGTEDLKFLRSDGASVLDGVSFGDSSYTYDARTKTYQNRSLASVIESLFQNVTVGLLHSPYLQWVSMLPPKSCKDDKTANSACLSRANYSSRFAPPPTNVTFHDIANFYVYSPKELWLGYGIALSCSFLLGICGLALIVVRQTSFSNDFSSILRVARHATLLGGEVQIEDAVGNEPLPKHLMNTTVTMIGTRSEMEAGSKCSNENQSTADASSHESTSTDFHRKRKTVVGEIEFKELGK
jgi:hypothetical protein